MRPPSSEWTAQPLGHHHSQPHVVLPGGHAALVEVEEHADAVALFRRGLPPLPVVPAGVAAPEVRVAEAVAVENLRFNPPCTSQPGRITSCSTVN